MPRQQTTSQRPTEMMAIKSAVRERDGFRCTKCKMTNNEHLSLYGRQLDVHRNVPGSLYSVEGCSTICKRCHGKQPQKKKGEIDLAWASVRRQPVAPQTRRERLATLIGASLRAERARSGMTLKQAGEKAGIHYVSISRYEQGKLPTLEALYSLADAYGIEPSVFLPSLAKVAESPAKTRTRTSRK